MADPFDTLLVQFCDVLERDTSDGDDRGLSDPSFDTIGTEVACRVSMGKSVGRGKEFRAKSKEAINYREVFMRPWYQDQSPDGSFQPYAVFAGTTYNTKPLTHDHWLIFPSQAQLNENGEPTPGDYFDIFQIDSLYDGLGALHHLEVWCQIILP